MWIVHADVTDTRHACQLGFLAGRNPGYRGEEFDVFEEELRDAWVTAQAKLERPLAWDQVRLG